MCASAPTFDASSDKVAPQAGRFDLCRRPEEEECMDWFMAVSLAMMIAGVVAVLVPSYWLVRGWWQDRNGGRVAVLPVLTVGRT
jgi:hypothetical protein